MTPRHVQAILARSASDLRPGRHAGAVAIMALALLLLAACSVDRRSDQYARCKNPSECPSGMCDQGWCVPVGMPGPQPDARPGPGIDAAPQPGCPAQCSECNGSRCIINCQGSDTCPAAVACPAGWDCEVECLGDQSCPAGVICGEATSCTVLCEGASACSAGVICGLGRCDVECSGVGACFAIDCSESCACDTDCDDGALCDRECPNRGTNCQRLGECSSAGCTNC